MKVIDSHIHCGIQDKYPPQDIDSYISEIKGSPIVGVVAFPPVMEVYDRYDPDFYDSPEWQERRRAAHDYLLTLSTSGEYRKKLRLFPFLFMWNDFDFERLQDGFLGIKWHRHPEEPLYRYDDPRCKKAIRVIKQMNLPIILEEEFLNTVKFIREYASGAKVIIPHCGLLNGGYERIKAEGLWKLDNVFADSALAPVSVIEDFIDCYGSEKLLFGSDFPFGHPISELQKILGLTLSESEKENILFRNILRLIGVSWED